MYSAEGIQDQNIIPQVNMRYLDMKKQRKSPRTKKSHPEHDHYLIRIKQGERLYKFYYFRPMASAFLRIVVVGIH